MIKELRFEIARELLTRCRLTSSQIVAALGHFTLRAANTERGRTDMQKYLFR